MPRNNFYTALLLMFFLATTSCRYKIEKYDDKIIGLWYYRDEECQRYVFFAPRCDDQWLLISEDGMFASMSGPSTTDTITWGPFPYELDGKIFTRHYPTGDRQDSVEIKWRLGGKKLTLSHIGGYSVKTYKFLKKRP